MAWCPPVTTGYLGSCCVSTCISNRYIAWLRVRGYRKADCLQTTLLSSVDCRIFKKITVTWTNNSGVVLALYPASFSVTREQTFPNYGEIITFHSGSPLTIYPLSFGDPAMANFSIVTSGNMYTMTLNDGSVLSVLLESEITKQEISAMLSTMLSTINYDSESPSGTYTTLIWDTSSNLVKRIVAGPGLLDGNLLSPIGLGSRFWTFTSDQLSSGGVSSSFCAFGDNSNVPHSGSLVWAQDNLSIGQPNNQFLFHGSFANQYGILPASGYFNIGSAGIGGVASAAVLNISGRQIVKHSRSWLGLNGHCGDLSDFTCGPLAMAGPSDPPAGKIIDQPTVDGSGWNYYQCI